MPDLKTRELVTTPVSELIQIIPPSITNSSSELTVTWNKLSVKQLGFPMG